MATNWNLIRETLSGMIDACETLENLPIDHPGYWDARSPSQPDVGVLDFLTRFWQYPEGCARDMVRIRSHLGCDAKHPNPLARAWVHTAMACSEAIGAPEGRMSEEAPTLQPHCGSAGKSMESQLKASARIAKGWMIPNITEAIRLAGPKVEAADAAGL